MQLGWPYPDSAHTPYWGTPTAIDNFCEEDYVVTGYVGEFVNTLTNCIYVFYACHGFVRSTPGRSGDGQRLAYAALGLVGVFSFAYHCTLMLIPNWCDSLSMLLAAGVVAYRVFALDRSQPERRRLAAGLIGSQVVVSIIFCVTSNTLAHNASFGLMVTLVARRARALLKDRVANDARRLRLRRAARIGSVAAVSAYVLWNIDHVACSYLGAARRAIGMPLGFVLELHGWWHVLTGIAAYIYLAIVDLLVSQDMKRGNDRFAAREFAWPLSRLLQE